MKRADVRKVTLQKTGDYQELLSLFSGAGLKNGLKEGEKAPEGFLRGCRAADPEGNILGASVLSFREGVYVMDDLAVREDGRGGGLGTRLMADAMIWLQQQGAEEFFLMAKAPGFFYRLGFRDCEEDDVPSVFHCESRRQYHDPCPAKPLRRALGKSRLLFVDSCISTHHSRTRRLCDAWIAKTLTAYPDMVLDYVMVEKGFCAPLDKAAIIKRNRLIEEKAWEDPMFIPARQFKAADEILVGAPYWDRSFPSALKVYVENIVVADLTFRETEKGYSGLCPGRLLTYITTAGGPIGKYDLGYQYIQGIGEMLGIKKFQEFRAEGLDIAGADTEKIMYEALETI